MQMNFVNASEGPAKSGILNFILRPVFRLIAAVPR
jgi:hypothetical protein